jgi:hypothetical protein
MLFKERDDTAAQEAEIRLLESIADLTDAERKTLAKEAAGFEKGEWGERKAAWYLDPEVREHSRRHLIHDLRVAVAGEWVQIDHVLWNISVDETGSCTIWYRKRPVDREAPHIQLRRQERLFQQLLKTEPVFRELVPSFTTFQYVLVPPTARLKIEREYRDFYRKMDGFMDQYRRNIDKESVISTVLSMVRMATNGDPRRIADELIARHTPRPCDLRKQLGWGKRTALLELPQLPGILGDRDELWQWVELRAAPAPELKRQLNSLGFRAMKRDGRWIWARGA